MKVIQLHGTLKQFGEFFEMDVASAKEAAHSLAMQIPAFRNFMLRSEQDGIRFAIFADDRNIGESQIDSITDAEIIHIMPKVMGAGGDTGIFQIVIGAALIGAAWFTGGISVALAEGMMMVGAVQIATGVASMLMPTPDVTANEPDGNRANYGFGGAVTTVAQGNPVPVAYGERMVGGFVASAGIYTEDTSAVPTTDYGDSGSGWIGGVITGVAGGVANG